MGKAITEVAKKNISPPEVHITGYVDLKSYAPNGVDVIKGALLPSKMKKFPYNVLVLPATE